jgi:hypothetical protein
MASNYAMMVEWGMPIEGRETKALEEFMTSVAWWGELKQKGRIAEFRTYGDVTGNYGKRAGLAIIEGTEQQINELRRSEDFRVRMDHVVSIGHNIRVTLLETGDAMTSRMQRYGTVIKKITG